MAKTRQVNEERLQPAAKTREVVYSFPTRSRCPRCGTENTRGYCTRGMVQYRKCLAPICRCRYAVTGVKV